MKRLAIAVLLSVFVAGTAIAADTGFYLGVKGGSAKKKVGALSDTNGAFGLFGGYTINPNFAVEAGYTNLGKANSDFIKFSTYDLSVLGIWPVNQQFSVYGKVGMASTKEEGFGFSVRKSAATWGLGGQFNVDPSIGIRVGYDRYKFGGTTGPVTFLAGDADLYYVAGVFKF